jgi:predicted transport protein
MKLILVLLFWLSTTFCFSQNISEEEIKQIFCESADIRIGEKELLDSFLNFDFSRIWLTNFEPIGFIGENYQRFYIHFDSITKDDNSAKRYQVCGETKVKDNYCNFQGEIDLLSIRPLNENLRLLLNSQAKEHGDDEVFHRTNYPIYVLIARYTLFEDQKQSYSGFFTGHLKSTFYIKNDSLYFDDLSKDFSDSYANNQFAGTWEIYNHKIQKRCNWGVSRIPCSKGLDIGAGFFSPSEKYLRNDWENYYNAYINGNQEAIKKEGQKWWK